MWIATLLIFVSAFMPPFSFFAPPAVAAQNLPHTQLVATSPSAEQLFEEFGLFGTWAIDCKKLAAPANPHVVTTHAPDGVREHHDLGPNYGINHYVVLSAERMSLTHLSIDVLFQPGTSHEEKQRLVYFVSNKTRRTLFNQPEGGEVRVKDGIVVARGTNTALLTKCEP